MDTKKISKYRIYKSLIGFLLGVFLVQLLPANLSAENALSEPAEESLKITAEQSKDITETTEKVTEIQSGSGTVGIKVKTDKTIEVSDKDDIWLFPRQVVGEPTSGREKQVFPSLDQVAAANYIVFDMETEEVILGHNEDGIAYPASMTKIMTALTVIESPDFDLQKPVVFSEYAVSLPSAVSANAGFVAGEVTSTENALYLMMVASANECARALAETYGGTEEDFANMMNEKALEIGCENTHLVDAAGFGLEDHYFTPRDLAKIIKRAMSHDIFRNLVTTKAYSSEPTNIHPYTGWAMVTNSNYLMLQGDFSLSSEYLHTYDGVKTGNTDLAGNCLSAAVHTYDGKHLVGIIFNGGFADNPEEFFSVSVLLRTLLEEGAKTAGCPTETEAYQYLADNPEIAHEVSGYQNLCQLSTLYESGKLSDQQIEALVGTTENEETIEPDDQREQAVATNGNGDKTTDASKSDDHISSLLSKNQYILLGMWALLFIVILILLIQLLLKSKRRRSKRG